ncbi:MAG: P-loop NTPase [Campylobacter gracilis]|uniref:nucleotide-binding protein n=1 Tax=Campylobacter gracilis TaxID=824 RepID=UPI0026ED3F3B|nr:P-loop NTPase [Campylobacter gracilis]MBS6153628.1 P-loop NTPase [Campylobacter gracilis]
MQTKIVNFLSAKGGVGKSVIAANFAEILSEQGYRTAIIEAPNLNNQEIILNALQRKRISLPSAVAVKISQNLTLVSPALASQNPASSQNSVNSANSMAQNSIKNASSNADNYVVQSSQDDESLSSHNYAQKLTSSDGKNNSENSAALNSIENATKNSTNCAAKKPQNCEDGWNFTESESLENFKSDDFTKQNLIPDENSQNSASKDEMKNSARSSNPEKAGNSANAKAHESPAHFASELKEAGIFDFILIDAGLEYLGDFLSIGDENIVLCANEPCSISNTYALLKTLGASKKEVLFLLNFTASEDDAVMIYDNLKSVAHRNISELGFKLLGFVPFCKQVAICSQNRALFNSHYPFSPATIALRQSVSRFLSKQGCEPIDMSAYRGVGGFLRKLSNLV